MERGFEVVTGFVGVELPRRSTNGSAGYDIRVITDGGKPVEIKPMESKVFKTGIKAYMNSDEVLKIYPRSSIGFKKHLVMSNTVGIIDSDYYNNKKNEGHILISLTNLSNETQVVEDMERVAQGIFVKYLAADDDVTGGERIGGVGSTDC